MIQVRVPATSANLAMGYDCLGMAVNIFMTVQIEKADKLKIIDSNHQFENEDNLVYQSFITTCQHLNQPIPTVRIDIESDIPDSGGLGQSAACIVAGIIGAYHYFDLKVDKEEALQLATHIEGHPDNVAPAIYGGLCMIYTDDQGRYKVIQYPINESLNFTAISPDFTISTDEARKIVPKEVETGVVAYQLSHCLAMLDALNKGDISQLKASMVDKIHEPYRKKLISGFDEIQAIADKHHGILYISGSGSTLIMISNSLNNRDKMVNAVKKRFKNYQIKNVEIMD